MEISDQTLIAYLDGELPMAERTALEVALAADAGLAARLQAHKALADQVRAAFAGVADEPVPDRLIRAVDAEPAETSNVVAFPTRRPAPARLWGGGGAIAASLALGVLVGYAVLPRTGAGSAVAIGPDMGARGALGQALDRQLASTRSGDPADVKIGISFRSKAGPICRTFRTNVLAGLACRNGDGWRVRMAVPAAQATGDGGYATAASSIPAEIMTLAGSTIDGRPFDAEAEARAKAGGWR